jgi:L-amino acid N-acyltransferase YncA
MLRSIAAIYNERIADRIATFETEPRSAAQIAEWFTRTGACDCRRN